MLTDEQRSKIIWYWDPSKKRTLVDTQVAQLSEEEQERLTPITNLFWHNLLKNLPAGKHIDNDPETNLPAYFDDPAPTEEELLREEKEEKQRYLESTNTETILYLQQLMTPMTMAADSSSQPVMTAEEYAEMNAKRLLYAKRIKEIDATLAG